MAGVFEKLAQNPKYVGGGLAGGVVGQFVLAPVVHRGAG